MLSALPRFSIQWAVIVKYAFIHLECHSLHVKASFISFQLLALLNLLINSTCKLDIYESIQYASQQNCNTSLHCNNTNHMSTTIKIVGDKENKTMKWKEEIRIGRNQEAAPAKRIQYLYGDTLSPKVWGHLGCCKLRRISSQDGPVGSSKVLLAQQRITSDVPAATLNSCSDDAHSTRAILPKLSWVNAVRQGNKFPRREVKPTRHLSDTTDAGTSEHGLQNRKTRKINKNDSSQHI